MGKIICISFLFASILLLSSCKPDQKEKNDTSDSEDIETLYNSTGFSITEDSKDASQRPQSNDHDPNLQGYKYQYNKSSLYEDGRFDNEPDYIAIPAKLKGRSEQLLFRKGYATSYNPVNRLPNWVCWHLTKEHTYGDVERPQRAFHDDTDVSNSTHYWDYEKGGKYNRGHMCPAGDNRWDSDAMMESFLMTNVCPQYSGLNSGVWNDIEIKCREWARSEGDVYIVCGPVYFKGRKDRDVLGKDKLVVPDAFFKVVLSNHKGGKGIGFLCENRRCSDDLNDYTLTIDEVERMTGIDFFPALPDEMEERIERGECAKLK